MNEKKMSPKTEMGKSAMHSSKDVYMKVRRKQGSIAKRTRKSGFKDDIHFLKVKKFSKRKHNTQTVQVNMDVSTKGMNE